MATTATRHPALQFHKASGKAVVRLGGKDFYCGKYGTQTAQVEYDRVLAEWLAAGRPTSWTKLADISVAELLVRYLDFAVGHYRPTSTEIDAVKLAIRPLKELYSHTPVASFGPQSLKTVRQQWVNKGLARKHINARVNRIRRVFKWGVEEELIHPSVLVGLQSLGGLKPGQGGVKDPVPRGAVEESVFRATLPHLRPQIAAMLELMWHTGARPSEIYGMKTKDLDRSVNPWRFQPAHHKTEHLGHSRILFFGAESQKVLTPWLRANPEEFVFQPKESVAAMRAALKTAGRTDGDRARSAALKRRAGAVARKGKTGTAKPVSNRLASERYTHRRVSNAVRRACLKCQIPHWTPYELRHAACTRIEAALGIEVARKVLGHKSTAMTRNYLHADELGASAAMLHLG